ncbi:MAG TPA: hypothetical protein ENI61_01170, partial [Ignavibacteria bacterium]|nr:hypothetical protein [Ignavibacteria bacterium]
MAIKKAHLTPQEVSLWQNDVADKDLITAPASPADNARYIVAGTGGGGVGSSLLLDGNSDYLTIPDHADWDIVGSLIDDYTIDFWIKFDSITATYVISQIVDGNNFWALQYGGGGFKFVAWSSGVNLSTNPSGGVISDTNWHHVTLVKKDTIIAIYLDGIQVTFDTLLNTRTFNANMFIGSRLGASSYLNGNLDEWRIQKFNVFSANPVVGLTDTITVPT